MSFGELAESSPGAVAIVTSIHPDFDARITRHAIAMAERGWSVDLICPWSEPEVELPANLKLVRFPRVTKRVLRPLLLPYRILRALRHRRFDIIHFHDLDILPLFALIKLLRPSLRIVYDCHENYSLEMMNKYYLPRWTRRPLSAVVRWAERLMAWPLNHVVLVVPDQKVTFPESWFSTTIVRNFAERSLEDSRRDDHEKRADICISIASQYVANGSLFILDVAREVMDRRPGVVFRAIDRFKHDVGLREAVLSRARELNLGEGFQLIPNVRPQEVIGYLNEAAIGLVLDLPVPHRIAALPIKLFEYMAAGLPIVAADLPNIRTFVHDASCGVLATPGNAASFADAICTLLADRPLAAQLGRNGLGAFRSRYNWNIESEKIANLYGRLLSRGTA